MSIKSAASSGEVKVRAVHIPKVRCLPVTQTLTWQEWMTQLRPEELACGRILRGRRRRGCKCRFCSCPTISLTVPE